MVSKWKRGQSYRQNNIQQSGNDTHSQLPGDTNMSTTDGPSTLPSQPVIPTLPTGSNGPGHYDNGSALPDTGPRTHVDVRTSLPTSSPSYSKDIDEFLSPAERSRILEERRKFESIKGLLLETINILFREYHVRGLKFFRRRVEDSMTLEELQVSSSMLMTLGRFHEVATPPRTPEDDQA